MSTQLNFLVLIFSVWIFLLMEPVQKRELLNRAPSRIKLSDRFSAFNCDSLVREKQIEVVFCRRHSEALFLFLGWVWFRSLWLHYTG